MTLVSKSKSRRRFGGSTEGARHIRKNTLRTILQEVDEIVDEADKTDSTNVLKKLVSGLKTWSEEFYNDELNILEYVSTSRNSLQQSRHEHFCDHSLENSMLSYDRWSKQSLNIETDEWDKRDLSENVFSILFICKVRSHVMIYSLAVVLFQFSIMAIVIEGGIRNHDIMPINVGVEVRISQILAIPLMIATQDDLIHGVACIYDGYDPKIKHIAPYATKLKFVLVYCLQVTVGVLYLCSIMTLIIKSETVIGLFLNFAALSFISFIDDVFFLVASHFMITDELAIVTRQLKDATIPVPKKFPSVKNPVSIYRAMNLLYLICILCIYFGYNCMKQTEGNNACQSILVQFGDESIAYLDYYSGAYDRIKGIGSSRYQINDRFVYLQRDKEKRKAVIAYCSDLSAWTITTFEKFQGRLDLYDPCKKFVLKSHETKSFDIKDTFQKGWMRPNKSDVDYLSIRCNECDDCYGGGQCVNDQCVCDNGNYGINCEFNTDSLCKNIFIVNGKSGTETKPFSIISESRIRNYSNRPIFYREQIKPDNQSSDIFRNDNATKVKKSYEVVLFTGRRWSYYRSVFFEGVTNKTETKSLDDFISDAIDFKVVPFSYSDPVPYGGHLDTAAPIKVRWNKDYFTKENTFESDSFLGFICPYCDSKSVNPCLNNGECEVTKGKMLGRCKCPENFGGYSCEEYLNNNKN